MVRGPSFEREILLKDRYLQEKKAGVFHRLDIPGIRTRLRQPKNRQVNMKIGTPYSESALRVMLLGAGELGKEVILSLQRYGVEVIAVDRYDHAPGMQVAHRSHTIVLSDPRELRRIVELERPHLIVPEIEALATEELLKIETEGLAEVIPTARAVNLTMNREGIRRLAAEDLGLPTSRYAFADSFEELALGASEITGFPCVIKPVMSSSGKGQSVARSVEDLRKSWETAMNSGRVNRNRVIVEEMIEFDYEITLLTVRSLDSKGNTVTEFCEPIGHIQQNGDYVESWQPAPMSPVALENARRIAFTITGALGGRGVFGVEMFIRGDEVFFSEVSPRPHDTGMVTMVTQLQNEFELHARAILGLPVNTRLLSPGASSVIYGVLNEPGIAFEGLSDALSISETEIRLFGKPESFSKRRMGVALARGVSVEESREKAKKASGTVRPVSGNIR